MSNKNLSEGTRLARSTLVRKVALESIFIPELTTYFNDIRDASLRKFRRNNEFLTATNHNFKTEEVLAKQYRRTIREFKGDIISSLKENKSLELKQDELNESKIKEKILAALAVFSLFNVTNSSREINRTTDKNIQESFSSAITEIQENEGDLTTEGIAVVAGVNMSRAFAGRKITIALSETQLAAEGTRFIEASVTSRNGEGLIPIDGLVQGSPLATKIWFSILDNKTRESHVVANRQSQRIDFPFIVQNEFLKFPRDTSLGASASNVINCRCEADYPEQDILRAFRVNI